MKTPQEKVLRTYPGATDSILFTRKVCPPKTKSPHAYPYLLFHLHAFHLQPLLAHPLRRWRRQNNQ